MGNHEFCENCHENDFHNHRDCDPEKVAAVKAKEAAAQKFKQERMALLEAALKDAGFNFKLDSEYGKATISCYDFDKLYRR